MLEIIPIFCLSGHEHLKALRIKKEVYDAVWKPLEGTKGFTIQAVLLHPKSTGTLTLHDKDPLHHPLVNTHALTDIDGEDVETILAGIHSALELAHTNTLQKLGIQLNSHKIPECEHYVKDEYWKCAVRYLSTSLGQVTGTVKMGSKPAEGACVDDKLRVHDVHKLRVVDSSVVPVTISGDASALNIVIGEKAADLLKEHWK